MVTHNPIKRNKNVFFNKSELFSVQVLAKVAPKILY